LAGGYLFLLGSLVGFSLLGILHKVADHPSCRPRMITMLLLLWGAALTAAYIVAFDKHGLRMPVSVLGMGAAAGAAASLALFAFQASLRYGKISTSWLVLNLCVAVPLLISITVYGEKLTAAKSVGVGLVFAAIVLMWWDKRIDLARAAATHVQAEDAGAMVVATTGETSEATAPATTPTTTLASKSKWLSLIMLAFVANGLAASSQKVLVELGGGDYAWQFYVMLYAAGAVVVAAANAMNSGFPNGREVLISAGMAIASVAGNICIVKALGMQVPGTIAYPVANGGSLFLVVLAGFLAFRERVNPVGVAGIVLGIAATLVLVLS
jgi:multidrug transporter EmrE-like cation transporter